MKMGDDPAGNTAGQVIVDILMTSVYAASLAAFHKAIDILITSGTKNGINGMLQPPTKTISSDSSFNPSRHQNNQYANNCSDTEVMKYYR